MKYILSVLLVIKCLLMGSLLINSKYILFYASSKVVFIAGTG
jgi:hypothetical protein